jgi:hypothetical protein
LGDATKKWLERVEALDEEEGRMNEEEKKEEDVAGDEDAEEKVGEEEDAKAATTVRHISKDEKADTQAMLPTDDNKQEDSKKSLDKKEQEKKKKQGEEEAAKKKKEEQNEKEDEKNSSKKKDDKKKPVSVRPGGKERLAQSDQMDTAEEDGEEDTDMKDDEDNKDKEEKKYDPFAEDSSSSSSTDKKLPESFIGESKDLVSAERKSDQLTPQLLQRLREELDTMLRESTSSDGHNLWQKFETLTADLSQQLCEQLRSACFFSLSFSFVLFSKSSFLPLPPSSFQDHSRAHVGHQTERRLPNRQTHQHQEDHPLLGLSVSQRQNLAAKNEAQQATLPSDDRHRRLRFDAELRSRALGPGGHDGVVPRSDPVGDRRIGRAELW